MHSISWKKIIARAEQRHFGDVQVEDERNINTPVKRGPIKRVHRDNHSIVFEAMWMAFMDHSGRGWRKLDDTVVRVSELCRPHIDTEGAVSFIVPQRCRVTLFSNSQRNSLLDPARVLDMTGDDIRQSRAREYALPLDSTWQQVVAKMRNWASEGGVSMEDQVRIQMEAESFSAT